MAHLPAAGLSRDEMGRPNAGAFFVDRVGYAHGLVRAAVVATARGVVDHPPPRAPRGSPFGGTDDVGEAADDQFLHALDDPLSLAKAGGLPTGTARLRADDLVHGAGHPAAWGLFFLVLAGAGFFLRPPMSLGPGGGGLLDGGHDSSRRFDGASSHLFDRGLASSLERDLTPFRTEHPGD